MHLNIYHVKVTAKVAPKVLAAKRLVEHRGGRGGVGNGASVLSQAALGAHNADDRMSDTDEGDDVWSDEDAAERVRQGTLTLQDNHHHRLLLASMP